MRHSLQADCSTQPAALSNQSDYWHRILRCEHHTQYPVHSLRDLSTAVQQFDEPDQLGQRGRLNNQYRQPPDADQLRWSIPAARVLSVRHYSLRVGMARLAIASLLGFLCKSG